MKTKSRSAFTLLEFIIVVAIVIILGTILSINLGSFHDSHRLPNEIESTGDGTEIARPAVEKIIDMPSFDIYRFELDGKTYLVNNRGGIVLHEVVKEMKK